jgi:hypothetical protein
VVRFAAVTQSCLTSRDSWAKQKGTDKVEAKQRYISALLKVRHHHLDTSSPKDSEETHTSSWGS